MVVSFRAGGCPGCLRPLRLSRAGRWETALSFSTDPAKRTLDRRGTMGDPGQTPTCPQGAVAVAFAVVFAGGFRREGGGPSAPPHTGAWPMRQPPKRRSAGHRPPPPRGACGRDQGARTCALQPRHRERSAAEWEVSWAADVRSYRTGRDAGRPVQDVALCGLQPGAAALPLHQVRCEAGHGAGGGGFIAPGNTCSASNGDSRRPRSGPRREGWERHGGPPKVGRP